jgi:hypothetical protein
MSDRVVFVLERFNNMLAGDGARLEPDSFIDGVLRLRYASPDGAECATCVLSPDDLEQLIQEALAGSEVSAVRIEIAPV